MLIERISRSLSLADTSAPRRPSVVSSSARRSCTSDFKRLMVAAGLAEAFFVFFRGGVLSAECGALSSVTGITGKGAGTGPSEPLSIQFLSHVWKRDQIRTNSCTVSQGLFWVFFVFFLCD
ncbi:MAG: hypothetical protein JNJ53_09560 [Rhizobiales bacterium]|nr:hypothetical protein [Hyphomicrobiales bacterium]